MSILQFIRKKVQPAWTYRADGVVWRIIPTDAGVFVGEDRNLDAKKVSFFCVNQKTGKVLWEGISFDEQWWIGIEATHRDRIFLHGFAKPDMPDHQGILALDLFTGRLLWKNNEMRFILAAEESVLASKNTAGARTILELSLRTGSVLRSLEGESERIQTATSPTHVLQHERPEFPVPMVDDHGIDDATIALVHKHCQRDEVVGPIEVIEKSDLVFFCCHKKGGADGRLRNVLKVADRDDGELVFSETLNQNLLSVVPDSFFLQGNMLYFVMDRSLLTAMNIDDFKS